MCAIYVTNYIGGKEPKTLSFCKLEYDKTHGNMWGGWTELVKSKLKMTKGKGVEIFLKLPEMELGLQTF